MIPRLRILLLVAGRSLVAHRVKSAIVGSILAFGTFVVVLGGAVLDSMEAAMERAITSSLAGQMQVYSADAEDPLSLFGGFGMSNPDIGEISDFGRVRRSLLAVPGVRAVVPMGITTVTVFGGNEIDRVLGDLRIAVTGGDREATEMLVGRVLRIVDTLRRDQALKGAVVADQERVRQETLDLERAADPTFWAGFDRDPLPALDFLDARIAPLQADARFHYLRVIGTDPDLFARSFDRFYVRKGQAIPAGERGIVLSDRTHERILKNVVARELDDIRKKVREGSRIADDELLAEQVARNARQYQRIVFELSPADSAIVEQRLREHLGATDGDLASLIQQFLMVTDSDVEARHALFYELIAPRIRLYDYAPGDVITLRAYTKAGYVKSVNVKVYGTYDFHGLEEADLATASNLADLATFRALYGEMSDAQRDELADIKASVGAREVSREDAEAALFGGGEAIEATAAPSDGFDDAFAFDVARATHEGGVTREELEGGLALNAAIVVEDGADVDAVRAAVADRIERDALGLQITDWQAASGLIGQFVVAMRIVLFVAIFVIFLVALVIINNTMVMATLERTPEIGTMRALGAQRTFVMGLFLVETLLLGLLSGLVGALAALGLIGFLGSVGIPAPATAFVLLFAGPRLYPSAGPDDAVFGVLVILAVTLLSTLYPARVASRVAPVVAMQGAE